MSNITLSQAELLWGNTNYERWNTNIINGLFMGLSANYHTPDVFNYIMSRFKAFNEWYATQPDQYIPRNGLETMYSKAILQEVYAYAKRPEFDESAFCSMFIKLLATYGAPRMIT